MSRGGSIDRVCQSASIFPSRIRELLNARWPLVAVSEFFGIDEEHSGTGGEADPGAIRSDASFRPVVGDRPTSRSKQSSFLKPDRVQDFVIPKDIAFRALFFLFDAGDEPECFGGFYIEDTHDVDFASSGTIRAAFESIENWNCEFAVSCAVNRCGLLRALNTTERSNNEPASSK